MYLSLLPYEFLSLHSTLCVSRSYEARDDFTRVALSRNIVQNDIAWFFEAHVPIHLWNSPNENHMQFKEYQDSTIISTVNPHIFEIRQILSDWLANKAHKSSQTADNLRKLQRSQSIPTIYSLNWPLESTSATISIPTFYVAFLLL